jgi:hypothetical protein
MFALFRIVYVLQIFSPYSIHNVVNCTLLFCIGIDTRCLYRGPWWPSGLVSYLKPRSFTTFVSSSPHSGNRFVFVFELYMFHVGLTREAAFVRACALQLSLTLILIVNCIRRLIYTHSHSHKHTLQTARAYSYPLFRGKAASLSGLQTGLIMLFLSLISINPSYIV